MPLRLSLEADLDQPPWTDLFRIAQGFESIPDETKEVRECVDSVCSSWPRS